MPLSKTVQFSQPLKEAILARQSWPATGTDGYLQGAPIEEDPFEKGMDPKEVQALEDAAFKRGLEEGQAEAAAEHAESLDRLAREVLATLDAVSKERDLLAGEVRAILPELIIEGVGRVLHGYEPDGETVRGIVAELLQGFESDDSAMRLFLNPVDLENLLKFDPQLSESYPGLRLVANNDYARGECQLEGRFGIADARFSSKLANLRKVLE